MLDTLVVLDTKVKLPYSNNELVLHLYCHQILLQWWASHPLRANARGHSLKSPEHLTGSEDK
jgi:hypothetical protein